MKSNLELVKFANQAIGCGYVYGTYGQICTTSLLDEQAKRYPASNQAGGQSREIAEKWLGKRVMDCSGLFKYFFMSTIFGEDPVYNSKYDLYSLDLCI